MWHWNDRPRWWKGILVIAPIVFILTQTALAKDPVKLWGPQGVPFGVPFVPWHIGISDGVGGVIIIGDDQADQSKSVIQRIDMNGVLIWEEGDVHVDTPGRYLPVYGGMAVSDATGGMFIIWKAASSNHSGDDIHAQHIDVKGRALWPDGGLVIPACVDPECWGGDGAQVIHDGNGGAIIAWIARKNPTSIAAQRVGSDGTFFWGPHGAEISGIVGYLGDIKIAGDGEGGVFIVWKEVSSDWIYPYGNVVNFYMQRFDKGGQAQWPGKGVKVSENYISFLNYHTPYVLTGDREGGTIIAWKGMHQLQPDKALICLQKIGSNGTLRWQPDAVVVGIADGLDLGLIPDKSGGAIIAWDTYSGNIYVQRITHEGNPIWGPDGITIYETTPYTYPLRSEPKIVGDGAGGGIVIWSFVRFSGESAEGTSVMGQLVNGKGEKQWGPDGFEIFYKPEAYNFNSLVWAVDDGAGGVIACGETEGLPSGNENNVLFAQRVSDQFTSWSTRTLKVKKKGKGNGSVKDSLGGIDCGLDCWETLPIGTAVTLAPTPDKSSGFVGWEGDPDCADGSLIMDTNKICEARFELLIPQISVSPLSKDFNHVDLGDSSSQTFRIENSGLVELNIGSVSVQGLDADEFILTQNGCTGKTLLPKQSCQLEIVFSPASRGSKTAEARIQSDDPDHSITTISLNGIGAQQEISVTPTYVYLGLVSPGDESEETILVHNDGDKDLTITSITSPSSPFSWSGGTCHNNTVLAPGESCTGIIVFTPSTEELFHSTFNIYSNDPKEPTKTVFLVGIGVHQGISITPTYVYFGFVSPGDESEETILVHNDGNKDLTITSITSPSSPFSWSGGTCHNNTVLPPGESCTRIIVFTPSTEELFHSAFNIYSNDPKEPTKTVFLSGVSDSPFREGPQAKWKISTISKGGYYNSIAIDPSGYPHISYLDDSNPDNYVLKHAFFDGKKWNTEVVDEGDVGWSNAIAIDSLGHIHIGYNADQPSAFRYAYFNGTKWTITSTIPSLENNAAFSSITLDNNNNPHIIYANAANELRYLRYNRSDWISETILFDAFGFESSSIALNSLNFSHISFIAGYPQRTLYANNISGVWEIQNIGDSDRSGSSIVLDSSGNPHIVYSAGGIKYSRYLGLDWETQNLTKGWDIGATEHPRLALDLNDHPHICFSYYIPVGEYGVETIIYAHFNGENWLFDVIDYKNSYYPSIALGPGGIPHVSYRRSSGREEGSILMYAYHPGVNLTVSKKGNGKGNVMSSPPGIHCGPVCQYDFQPGLQITLTALPDQDSGFAGWAGCPNPSGNKCTFVLNDNFKVTALFSKFTLKVSKTGVNKATGTIVSSDGKINCGTDCIESYPAGTTIALKAIPDMDSGFAGWTGCTSDPLDFTQCTVVLDKNITVKAKFSKSTLTVKKTSVNKASGSVVSSDGKINCGTDCSESYPTGTSVTLTAQPDLGSTFSGWSGTCSGTLPECTVLLNKKISVTAKFIK